MVGDQIWGGEGLNISEKKKNGTYYEFTCKNQTEAEQYVEIPLLYYHGYKAENDENRTALGITKGNNGKIRVMILPGFDGKIKVAFQEPLSWRVSEMIFLVTLLILLLYCLKEKNSKEKIVEA